MRYCVLFPRAENIHLIKDVGMIAYKFNKLFNYEASVACYNNDDYFYLNNYVKGLKVEFIEKKHKSEILDGIEFLRNNAKKIDVLQVFHITMSSFAYIFFYKLFNKNGKIFLKLDCTEELIQKIKGSGRLVKAVMVLFLKKTDVIGVEQKGLHAELKKVLRSVERKITLVPNGFDFDLLKDRGDISALKKENTVINVSRIGSPEKNIHVLMEAFFIASQKMKEPWKLILIGPVEEEFKKFIGNFYKAHPEMKNRIIFKGPIYDRYELFREYKKSRIYCCSSEYESFGISMMEAAAFGNVIVSSKVGIAEELAEEGRGKIVDKITAEELSQGMLKFINCSDLEAVSSRVYELCRSRFDWNDIVLKLKKSLIN